MSIAKHLLFLVYKFCKIHRMKRGMQSGCQRAKYEKECTIIKDQFPNEQSNTKASNKPTKKTAMKTFLINGHVWLNKECPKLWFCRICHIALEHSSCCPPPRLCKNYETNELVLDNGHGTFITIMRYKTGNERNLNPSWLKSFCHFLVV